MNEYGSDVVQAYMAYIQVWYLSKKSGHEIMKTSQILFLCNKWTFVVDNSFEFLQQNAEVAVREMLKEIARKTKERTGSTQLEAIDHMDDGSSIKLKIQIDDLDVRFHFMLWFMKNRTMIRFISSDIFKFLEIPNIFFAG